MSRVANRAWLFIVLAFVTLIGAWTSIIVVAHHHALEPIPLPAPAKAP